MIDDICSITFGLTADPIHKGHEQAIINGVEFMRRKGFKIDKFILVPVYHPNLIADKNTPVASYKHRKHMCDLAVKRLSKQLSCKIVVSQIEKELATKTGDKNYSYHTIKHLSLKNSLFMLSADHFSGRRPKFREWYKWKKLLQHTGLLINQRPGHKSNLSFLAKLKIINPNIFVAENKNTINISSSQIRSSKVSQEFLSIDVYNHIKTYNLY